uniref:Uncharacterized protein n=1 Tax=Arundo donax TaxID=35708 RepID=A0A0A9BLZ5_ARUDO
MVDARAQHHAAALEERHLEHGHDAGRLAGGHERHEHPPDLRRRLVVLEELLASEVGPGDDEERALAVAVDLQTPALAHAEPPGQRVERHQRLGQRVLDPLRREEALSHGAVRRRGRRRRVVVDERRVRLGHGEVEVGQPQLPPRSVLARRHQRRLQHLNLHRLPVSLFLSSRTQSRTHEGEHTGLV